MGLLSRIKKTLGGGDEPRRDPDAAPATVSVASAAPAPAPLEDEAENFAEVLATLKVKVVELSNGQISDEAIDPSAVLFDFGYVDSLSSVTLISFIDEEYDVSITELDLVGSLNTLRALSDYVGRLAKG